MSPDDGFKTYKCRTKHRLTGDTKLSATAGKLVITGRTTVQMLNERHATLYILARPGLTVLGFKLDKLKIRYQLPGRELFLSYYFFCRLILSRVAPLGHHSQASSDYFLFS